MLNCQKENKNTIGSIASEACIIGCIRALIKLPVEHPFDRLKTECQIRMSQRNFISVAYWMIKNNGIRSLYTGCYPNALRAILKESYRFPLIITLPYFYQNSVLSRQNEDQGRSKIISNQVTNSNNEYSMPTKKFMPYIISGLTMALFESIIFSPLERLKILKMGSNHNTKYRDIINIDIRNPKTKGLICNPTQSLQRFVFITKHLFVGFSPFLIRQIVSWVTFLTADSYSRSIWKRSQPDNKLTFFQLISSSFMVGTINTTCTMPFDTMKTYIQKAQYTTNVNSALSLVQVFQSIQKKYGYSAFFSGYSVRWCQYILNALLTVPALDHLENKIYTMN